ncbi:MAG: hemerythrin family protein [Magnetococcales bacterium]|nr:hemerythrin family protein [Magnetococcales bacterium]
MSDEMVQSIAWRRDFATGVGIIDDQHRVLINMLNDAAAKLTDQSTAEEIGRIVRGLLNYADYHFKIEERLIEDHGYARERSADAGSHLREHREFVAQVMEVGQRLEQGKRVTRDELVTFLIGWLTNHILHSDKILGAFLLDKRIGGSR